MAKAYSTYTVIVKKAYFYKEANENSRLNTFIVQGQEVTDSEEQYDENDEFIYTSFTYKGKTTSGWVKISDLSEI